MRLIAHVLVYLCLELPGVVSHLSCGDSSLVTGCKLSRYIVPLFYYFTITVSTAVIIARNSMRSVDSQSELRAMNKTCVKVLVGWSSEGIGIWDALAVQILTS